MIGDEVVVEARRWLGTTYVHQASVRGIGCDCLGLVRGIWRALYGTEPEAVPQYQPDWDEIDHRDRLWRAAARHLEPKAANDVFEPGDVILFRMRDGMSAKHLGVISSNTPAQFIHAYSGHGVVENALSEPWARRVVARFAFPERSI